MIEPKLYNEISCVYKLTQEDGRFYIGSTKNLYRRLRTHKCDKFKHNFHTLKLDILEVTDNLKERESFYIKTNWCNDIINIERKSTGRDISGNNNPMKNMETRKIVSEKNKISSTGENNKSWKGGITALKKICPVCQGYKNYSSKTCLKCRPDTNIKRRENKNKL